MGAMPATHWFLRPEPACPVGPLAAEFVQHTGVHILEIPVDRHADIQIDHHFPDQHAAP
jgi:hypothetical protein